MKKTIKIISISLLVIITLIIIAVTSLLLFINPNDYKDDIKNIALENKVILNINGDISWSFYPYIGFRINDTDITDANTLYTDNPLAKFNSVGLSIKLLPLLNKELNINNIYADNLTANIYIDKYGKSNFDSLINSNAENKSKADEGIKEPNKQNKPEDNPDTKNIKNNFVINGINIENANINYINEQNKQRINITNFNLITDKIAFNHPIVISSNANIKIIDLLDADFKTKINLIVNNDFNGLAINIKDFTSNVKSNLINDKTANINLVADILIQNSNIKTQVHKLAINNLISQANLSIDNSGLSDIPIIAGDVNINEFNLRSFLSSLGIETPKTTNPNSLTKLKVNTKFESVVDKDNNITKQITLPILNIKLDNTNINTNLLLTAFAENLRLNTIKINIDDLNLDDYLPPKTADISASNNNKNDKNSDNDKLANTLTDEIIFDPNPIFNNELLQGLKLDLNIDKIVLNKIIINNIATNLSLSSKNLNLTKLVGNIYNGKFDIKANLDNKLSSTINIDVKNMPIANFIELLALNNKDDNKNKKSPITGDLNFNANLTSKGLSSKKIVANLNGNSDLIISNAVINEINLDHYVCEAIAFINKKELDNKSLFNQTNTKFKQLGGKFNIKNGVVYNPNLNAEVAGFNIKGRGEINLNDFSLDYLTGLIIEGSSEQNNETNNSACQINEKYRSIEWPVKCKGSLDDIAKACKVDTHSLGKLVKKFAQDKINQKLEAKFGSSDVKEVLKDKLGEKIENSEIKEHLKENKDKLKKSLKKLIK